ncbi:phospholipase D family protein [Thioalkalivibrio sp.]|uniref:phospholipase D family protein n=1 Tax=Thioalkalivibrio sp. TaxID=2093813 RepID=UPI00356291AB
MAPLLVLALCACSTLPDKGPLLAESALGIGHATALDNIVGAAERENPDRSGLRLVSHGPEALAVRVHTAELAERSIDVQTYIWNPDLTGLFLAHTLLEAAQGGVRVRLLLDDFDARAKNYALAALDRHPNISVRLFNPVAARQGALPLIGEWITDGRRLNRRMHNKIWIVDNRIAIGGGRNLGNEYFGASDGPNFVDLDLAMVGPVVRQASVSFDDYWNAGASYPVSLLNPEAISEHSLQDLRRRLAEAAMEAWTSEYASAVRGNNAVQRLVQGDWTLEWTNNYRFVSDDPDKVSRRPSPEISNVLAALLPVLDAAEDSIKLISPYFVPGSEGTDRLVDYAGQIGHVGILTNSLASNDVVAVHGGYSKYRADLLRGGVQLWELKPVPGVDASWFGSSGASLHTKALTVDGQQLFVGSYNLDPRSTSLNTEQGVLVRSEILSAEFEDLFAAQTSGHHAWEVTLDDDGLRWSDGSERFERDPQASAGKRFMAWLTRWLPVERQL